jgi:hypothetical protein
MSIIVSGPNGLSAQLVKLVLFYFGSIQTSSDSDNHHVTASSCQPSVQNQELQCVLLSPSETDTSHSSPLPQNESTEELHLAPTVSPPQHRLRSLLHPINGVGSLTIPLGFSCVRTLSRQSSRHCRHHSSLPDRIRHSAAPSYGR